MAERIRVKRTKDEILEILVVVLLGVVALLTAWATWIGSLHEGNQANNYTKSNNISADGNSRWNQAAQNLSADMALWNSITEIRIDRAFAENKGDQVETERANWKLAQLSTDSVGENLQAAINWADEQEEYASPFSKEGFVESYFADAQTVLDEAQAVLEQGQKDNEDGDAYGLVTVVYSIVLFLLGIAGSFKNTNNKIGVIAVSVVGMVFATAYMMTLSMPTDFSIVAYLGM
ncbi:MAG: hypothetical protein RR977_02195 [Oscillospiraceae bacterium]